MTDTTTVKRQLSRGGLLRAVPDDVLSTSVIGSYCRWLEKEKQLRFANYQPLWEWSVNNLPEFWSSVVEFFDLNVGSPSAILDSPVMPGAHWLPGAKLSYAEHALRFTGKENAIVGISQTRDRVQLSRDELLEQVARCATGLKKLGVKKGDRVAAYLPNIPEAMVAFLATASLGAVWVSTAPEFGVKAVIDRFKQVEPDFLFVVAGYCYGDKVIDRSEHVTQICAQLPSLKQVVEVAYLPARALAEAMPWSELLRDLEPLSFEKVDFDHPLYILFSSGTTGLPKAIIHGHGGMLLEHVKALALHNDVRAGDVFFWFSTTGWMVWNYSVSALTLGASVVCFDGNPMWPDAEALWKMAAQEKVTYFGNSASFYMSCRNINLNVAATYDLNAIRGIGSTGSVLPALGFDWIAEQFPGAVIGSASGGTDICSAFISASPMVPIRSGEIASPMLGCNIAALDERGEEVIGEPGELVIKSPMPSMPVGFWRDEDGSLLKNAYYTQNPGLWTHGDWIIIFDDYASVIVGRSDATLNRGGVRLGTADFYSVVEEISGVQDSLVVHLEDSSGGSGLLILFVAADNGENLDASEQADLSQFISQRLKFELSPRHVPDQIVWLPAIPRTLTGKKIETPVKKILKGASPDTVVTPGSLQNAEVLHDILAWYKNFDRT